MHKNAFLFACVMGGSLTLHGAEQGNKISYPVRAALVGFAATIGSAALSEDASDDSLMPSFKELLLSGIINCGWTVVSSAGDSKGYDFSTQVLATVGGLYLGKVTAQKIRNTSQASLLDQLKNGRRVIKNGEIYIILSDR